MCMDRYESSVLGVGWRGGDSKGCAAVKRQRSKKQGREKKKIKGGT